MSKDWQRGSKFMDKDPKVVKELGVGADGYATGGVTIPMTSGTKAEVATVKGTKACLLYTSDAADE